METYGQRLKHAMELARVDRAKLATALGISVQAVGHVIKGKTKLLMADKSARVARLLRVDHFWLATGEGEPRPSGLSEDAKSFAARYEKLDSDERRRLELLLQVVRNGVPDERVEEQMPVTAKRPKAKQPD